MSDGTRSVIFAESDNAPPSFTPRANPVVASSWLAAKKAFGFDLTPIQQSLLAAQGVEK